MHTKLQARKAEVGLCSKRNYKVVSEYSTYQQNKLPQSKVIFTFFRLTASTFDPGHVSLKLAREV